jgi:hypothetical protein
MLSRAAPATIAGFLICKSLAAGVDAQSKGDSEQDAKGWEYSFENLTYLAQHARDYSNPNFTADYDSLHLEARYNYEALKTGSVWLGYNFSTLNIGKLKVDATPMLGGVFGDITGVAPGYWIEATLQATYGNIKASTQGEYFFDAGNNSNDFFYSWSEFSASPSGTDWFRVGLVVERTQASGNSDVRRGPLIGFKYKRTLDGEDKDSDKDVDLTIYWLAPGSREATFVFGVKVDF